MVTCETAWCRKMALSSGFKFLTGVNVHPFSSHTRLCVCALLNSLVQIRGYAKKAGMILFSQVHFNAAFLGKQASPAVSQLRPDLGSQTVN